MRVHAIDDIVHKYKWKISLYCLATAVSILFPLIMTLIFENVIEMLETDPDSALLIRLLIYYCFFFVASSVSKLILNYFYTKMLNSILRESRAKYHSDIFNKDILSVENTAKPDLLNNFNIMKEYIDDSIMPVVFATQLVVSTLISAICILKIEKAYFVPLLIFVFAWLLLNIFTDKKLTDVSHAVQEKKYEMFESTIALHQGIDTIQSNDKFDFFYDRYLRKCHAYIKKVYDVQMLYAFKQDIANQLINYGAILFLILCAGTMPFFSPAAASLLTIYYFIPYLFMPLPNIANIRTKLIEKKALSNKLSTIQELEDISKRTASFDNTLDALFTFSDVSYHYKNSSKKVFDHFNFEIRRGKCYVILGDSGRGKTTLLNMLLGLIPPDSGEVVNGPNKCINISEQSMINSICVFTQNFYVFNDSILNNITFGEGNRKETALELCDKFHISQEFSRSDIIEKKYKSSALSAGQQQRIVLLRLLCQDKPIYLFDEPTSFLDKENENVFLEMIHLLKDKGKTIIIVTHRETFEGLADQILELK